MTEKPCYSPCSFYRSGIVSFRSHSHVVEETDEVAQICLTVRPASGGGGCPVDYSFTVSIIKMDITAGF
jgi:hypothetical protein